MRSDYVSQARFFYAFSLLKKELRFQQYTTGGSRLELMLLSDRFSLQTRVYTYMTSLFSLIVNEDKRVVGMYSTLSTRFVSSS